MIDLTAIRALLASTSRFTDGPWIAIEYAANDAAVAVAETDEDKHEHPGALIVGQTDAHDARLIAAAPTLHAHLTDLVGEVERLRAHNARTAAQINALADACEREESAPPGSFPICDALPPGHWPETATALRALAAGEVDDG